ncbi:MAG: hypothetical protein Q9220_003705 [cf. Caloplaca sp. 1 TL-2023]
MTDPITETTEPDPSSTGISNDATVNSQAAMQASNPTIEANTKSETGIPSADEVDKLIAEVEAKKLQKEAGNVVTVETDGHEEPDVGEKQQTPIVEKKVPSQRVQEAQKYNNRDRKPRKNFRENYKSDLTSQKESNDPVAIRKQVEFYFSDSNLLQDEFLFGKVQGHDNLPVAISIVHSFKRMRHFQPYSTVVEVLKDSATLDVVDGDSIQRKTPLPEGLKDKPMTEVKKVFEDEAMKRSVYVKGFGEEQPSTQFDIEAFFAEYGPTNSVRLRRTFSKLFKGSVFVEFDSEENQEAFLSHDPKPKWKGQDLLIKSKKQYCDDKIEDIKAGHVKPRHGAEKGRQGNDERDWKARRAEDQRNGHRRGGGKGFGSHKGGRGRGGRQGNHQDRSNEGKQERDSRDVPQVLTTADPEEGQSNKGDAVAGAKEVPAEAGIAGVSSTDKMPQKRAREDGDGAENGEGPLKKVDSKVMDESTKAEAPLIMEGSKKRSREEDHHQLEEGQTSKKVAIDPTG